MPDVLEAARRIKPHLAPTPLRYSVAMSEMVGTDVYSSMSSTFRLEHSR
jgi:threonine dehydratase